MQSLQLQASWPGRTYAFARCSIGEKKTRNRRTKQERKTMADAFIKKYQNLNNGKFPSLSLTHKEVGGSFYTVREIVREIIQENRVLGPGSLNSKALNLEYFPEEQTGESFSMDMSDTLCISSINHTINQSQEDNCSASNEYITRSPEIIEVDKLVNQEHLVPNLNDMFVPQVLHEEQCGGDLSSGEYLNEMLPTQLDVANDKSEIFEETNAEVQVSSSEAEIHSFEQQTSSLDAADEKFAICKQMHTEGQVSNSDDFGIHKLEQPAPSLEVAAGHSGIHEHMSAEDLVISSETPESNLIEQSSPLSEVANKSGVLEERHTDVQVSRSDDPGTHKVEQSAPPPCDAVPISPSLGKVVVNAGDSGDRSIEVVTPFNSFPAVNSVAVSNCSPEANILLNSVPPSSSGKLQNCHHGREYSQSAAVKTCDQDKSQAENDVESMFLENSSFINESETAESLSAIAVHEASVESHSKRPKNLDSSASESMEPPLFQSNDLQNVVTNIKITSGESHQHSVNGRPHVEAQTEPECTVNENDRATTFRRIHLNEVSKESEILERNPFWAAVKSFLNAVAKFWSE